jgi:hypothetical protein
MKCTASSKETGKPCRANARPNGFCHFHDPDAQEALRETKRKGGQEKQRRYPQDTRVMEAEEATALTVVLENAGPKGVIAVCEKVIKAIITGKLDVRMGSAVASLLSVAVSAMRVKETDSRLSELERKTRPLEGLTQEQLLQLVREGQRNGVAAVANSNGH